MNRSSKKETYRQSVWYIRRQHLSHGYNGLKQLAEEGAGLPLPESLLADMDIYRQMLQYFAKGAPDPERQKLLEQIMRNTLNAADRIYTASLSSRPSDVLHTFRKQYRNGIRIQAAELALVSRMMDEAEHSTYPEAWAKAERIFFSIWMADELDTESLKALREFFLDDHSHPETAVVWLSALILHLLEKFSVPVWMALADVYENGRHQLWQRAMIGLLLPLVRFNDRMGLYPDIEHRFLLMAEDDLFRQRLQRAAIQLIRAGDTEKISQRVQDEIMPQMMKLAPKIREKLSLDQFLQDDTGEEKNPDWEKFFEESPEVYKKLEELNKLQSEGADLFVSTFSQLKHFPFFKSIPNWFLPFMPGHPLLNPETHEVENGFAMRDFLEVFSRFPIICNSDKYSFGFNLLGLPAAQQRMLTGALSAEMDEMTKVASDDALASASTGYEVFHQFTQDLYRFVKLHPSHKETGDPFAEHQPLTNSDTMRQVLNEYPEITRVIGEYYFQEEHYLQSSNMFEILIESPQDTPELYQKLGYSYQMIGVYDAAINCYRKAELYDTNTVWNLRKIAWCHHMNEDLPAALEAYRQAEHLEPDSVQLKLNIGNILLQAGEWEEALHYYLKAEELRPGDIRTLRPVAWSLFLLGQNDTAEYYYEQIMELSHNHNDLLNFGHVKFVDGKREEALSLYQRSLHFHDQNPDDFFDSFRNDRQHLERLGITPEDISCMLDAVFLAS